MNKKLNAYFNNEDEAMSAVTKLRAAGVKIISTEEVYDEADLPRLPGFLAGMASLGGLQNMPSIGQNMFYPYGNFDEEFAAFDDYSYGSSYQSEKGMSRKYMVRMAVNKQNADEAVQIINENRGRTQWQKKIF